MSSRFFLPATLALVLAGGIGVAGCGGPEYAVGDCVKVDQRLTDQELEGIECSSDDSSLGDPIYKVDAVIEGKDGSCSNGGIGSVTFSDEPADSTYCLSFSN